MRDIRSELDKLSLSADARKKMQTSIENWLKEEGYSVKADDSPNDFFYLGATHSKRLPFTVFHPTTAKDRIQIMSNLDFGKASEKIKTMEDQDKQSFIWDICYTLLGMSMKFGFVPDVVNPTSIAFAEVVFYDGLTTKDKLMSLVDKL